MESTFANWRGAMLGLVFTAAVVREKGSFVLETVHLEDPRDDEILVKIVAAGQGADEQFTSLRGVVWS